LHRQSQQGRAKAVIELVDAAAKAEESSQDGIAIVVDISGAKFKKHAIIIVTFGKPFACGKLSITVVESLHEFAVYWVMRNLSRYVQSLFFDYPFQSPVPVHGKTAPLQDQLSWSLPVSPHHARLCELAFANGREEECKETWINTAMSDRVVEESLMGPLCVDVP